MKTNSEEYGGSEKFVLTAEEVSRKLALKRKSCRSFGVRGKKVKGEEKDGRAYTATPAKLIKNK